mgnify:CR=1 FL=1
METGFGRNLLAELLDSVGRGVLLMALGIGWFVFLWGLNLPALLAGIALGTLLLLLRRLYRQTTLVRRETALRCRIGGELLLEKMLLSEAKEAHFQAALLLEEKWPLRMQRITADGALCRQEKPSGGVETLLMTTSDDCASISSSIVRQVAAFGGDISPLVPEGTAGKILSALSGRQA